MAAQIIADSAFTAVVRALNTAEAAGWQPERMIADAARRGDLATADNPAKLLAWRINATADDRTAPAHLNAPSHADAARYAALITTAVGISAERLNLHAATATPAALRVGHADGAAADTYPRVPAGTLGRYAEVVAAALKTTADQVTGHRAWPHLAGTLAAADRAGRDVNTLLATAPVPRPRAMTRLTIAVTPSPTSPVPDVGSWPPTAFPSSARRSRPCWPTPTPHTPRSAWRSPRRPAGRAPGSR